MEITEIRINLVKKTKKNSSLLAFANVTFDDEFCVTGIKIVEGKNGKFVSMPSQKGSDDEYHDICFPLSKELREEITEEVLDAYKDEAKKSGKKSGKKSAKKKSTKKAKDEDEDEDDDDEDDDDEDDDEEDDDEEDIPF